MVHTRARRCLGLVSGLIVRLGSSVLYLVFSFARPHLLPLDFSLSISLAFSASSLSQDQSNAFDLPSESKLRK